MATGTQTGMRTGYSSAPTGARCSAPAVSNSPLQKIIKIINSMPPKQKMIAGVIIGFILVTVISFACISKASQYVALYDTKLTESDFKAIGDKLTQLGIDYKTEGSGTILISPAQKNSAKMQLTQYGLPRRALSLSVPDNTFTPLTPAALEQKHIQQLEIEIAESIRQLEGIMDAFVKIAVPKTDYFAQDKKSATALILLKTQPGISLTNTQVKSIAAFISSSVDGLKPENVQIVVHKGFNFRKVAYEKELEQKVQRMLDAIVGIGKSKVVIKTSLDHQRLTVNVLVDNFKPDITKAIKNLVKDALGIDEARGDSITVASMPFASMEHPKPNVPIVIYKPKPEVSLNLKIAVFFIIFTCLYVLSKLRDYFNKKAYFEKHNTQF